MLSRTDPAVVDPDQASASLEAAGARGRQDLSHAPWAQLEMPASLGNFSKPLSRWRGVTKTLIIWAAYLSDILK